MADVARGLRLFAALPGLLHRPLNITEAREILRRRLETREADFLAMARRVVYGLPESPYRRLLALAGCEYGDLARLVAQDGVETALETLARHGVHLTMDEFKGRRSVVRGSTEFEVDPAGLVNPGIPSHLFYRSSGSRGPGTVVSLDLAYYRGRAVNAGLCLAARGGREWCHALWLVPGGAASLVLLPYATLGTPPVAWFSQIDPRSPDLDPSYAWSERLLRWGSRLAGTVLPRPVHVPLERALVIGEWMRVCLATGRVPHLLAFPSSAVELCRAAVDAGIDLVGARLSVGGEPVTPARLSAVRAAGAEALPHYGSMETGFIGEGCLTPAAADEIHLFHDLHAVVQADSECGEGVMPPPLLISSLRSTAPVILLNVSLGDRAVLTRRCCGCPLEALGWTTHLHAIRSYEKLTAAGMTLLDSDVISALEEVLPARFGGSATDYQLLEEEDAEGRPHLVLVVSPRVGSVDTAAVMLAFLDAVGAGSGASAIAGLFWSEAGVLRIERRTPLAGATGKILHCHLSGRAGVPGGLPR